MLEQQLLSSWQTFSSVPRDGTAVDLWNGRGRILNMRYLRADEVDARFAAGGCWAHLARDGFRRDENDESVLVEDGLTHWRLVSADRPC